MHADSQFSLPLQHEIQALVTNYPFEKANYWDYELEKIRGLVDPQECARRCDKNQKCKVASVHGPEAPDGYANMCVLRSAVGSRHTEQPDIKSWVKP